MLVFSQKLLSLPKIEKDPYVPSTVLATGTNGYTSNGILAKGVYRLDITGGGGGNVGWAYSGYPWSAGGGSGATWEGDFYNPSDQSYSLYAAGDNGTSTFSLNGVSMITAGGGGNGYVGGGGGAGGLTVNSALQVVATYISRNGNGGNTAFGGNATGGASTSSHGWGAGVIIQSGIRQGGVLLKYLRLYP